ncbi:hypothetical protein [Streptomyces sp. NPDC096324]|uniref:hypothetical protein n=1 Tax=Streptomyces sp. NPDC096324 TaxID=3366085 RepID=UPI00380C9EA9
MTHGGTGSALVADQGRTIFFYVVVFVQFLFLAVTPMIGAFLRPSSSGERCCVVGAVGAGVLVLLTL